MTATWDRRSVGEQRRVQELVLDRWLDAAATYSPFWSQHLRAAGVDPAAVTSVEELAAAPPVREVDVTDVGGPGSPALVLRPTEEQLKATADVSGLLAIARGIRRGGADGKRRAFLTDFKPVHLVASGRDGHLAIAYARSDLDRLHRAGKRAATLVGLRDSDYVVSAVPAGDTLGFWAVRHLALGASILAVHPRGAGEPLDVAVSGFALVPATAVVVPVTEAIAFGEAVHDAGVAAGDVRTVLTVGPPPRDDRRAAISEAWHGAPVAALWAPNGGRYLWAECAEAAARSEPTGLHTFPDLEVVEVLDPVTRRPAASGDLTTTSIGWNGTALVRYSTGDFASGVDDGPCPACGRTLPRVRGPLIPGAWQPVLRGEQRVDLRGVAVVLGAEAEVEAWRVEVRGPAGRRKDDGYVVELAGDLDGERLVALDAALASAVGHPPRQLVLEDAGTVRSRVAEVGAVFEDAR